MWFTLQAGFICAILIVVAMAGLTLYTAYRVLKSPTYCGMCILNFACCRSILLSTLTTQSDIVNSVKLDPPYLYCGMTKKPNGLDYAELYLQKYNITILLLVIHLSSDEPL